VSQIYKVERVRQMKKIRKPVIILLLSVSLLFGLFQAFMANFPTLDQKVMADTEQKTTTKEISQKPTNRQEDYQGLRKKILAQIQGKQGKYGIYLKDLKTGQTISINGEQPFTAASTYKVPLNLYLYEKIISGEIDPNTRISYQASDYETGTGILQGTKVGTTFSIKYLSEISLTVSDNIAKNMLERYLGGRGKVLDYMAALEAKTIPHDPYVNNLTSPRDMSIYMEEVLRMSQKYPQIAGKLMSDLKHTQFNDRINVPLPKDVEVAHKIGTQINVINDTAIVFHTDRPYILTIMTGDINNNEAYATIHSISKLIYDFQESL